MIKRYRILCELPGPGNRMGLTGCVIGLMALVTMAHAQEDPAAISGKPSWYITPSITGMMTMTDNVNPGGSGEKQSDFITSVAPAIRIDGKGGRVSGSMFFSWQKNFYADENSYNNDQKFLNATGKAELVEQWLFLDASANISQQPESIFGTQSVGNELVNDNLTETTSYQWSPYIQGVLGGAAEYELRYSNAHTSSTTGLYSSGSGVDNQLWSGRLAGATRFAPLGWTLSAEDQRNEGDQQRDILDTRLTGTLEYQIDPQVKVSLLTGWESENYSSIDKEDSTFNGYGINWAPTERTSVSIRNEKRRYGDVYTFDFSHRTALTAWRYTDSQNVVLPGEQYYNTSPITTNYDMIYLQLASDPRYANDPLGRAQATNDLLTLLGIPANSPITGNIMNAQPYLQHQRQASVSLIGANNTVTFSVQSSSNEAIQTGASTLDDFALSQNISQSGASASWARKLTPDTSLTLNLLTSHSSGDNSDDDSRLRSWSLQMTSRLGVRTTAGLGIRHNDYESTGLYGSDYTENAIIGTLSASF